MSAFIYHTNSLTDKILLYVEIKIMQNKSYLIKRKKNKKKEKRKKKKEKREKKKEKNRKR